MTERARAACLVGALAAWPTAAVAGAVSGTVTVAPAAYTEETVVYLEEVPGKRAPRRLTMNQQRMVFVPHVLTITVGDTVVFLNGDSIEHNIFSPDHETYNFGVFGAGQSRSHTFKETGVYRQLCAFHAEMIAYIFVGQNPYAAAVDKSGRYSIEDVPPGTYRIAAWNSHAKAPEQSVTVGEERVEVSFTMKR